MSDDLTYGPGGTYDQREERVKQVVREGSPIVNFLRARLDEDELSSAHVARYPARVLAEVASKRKLIDEALFNIDCWAFERGTCDDPEAEGQSQIQMAEMDRFLRALASVYADHPDYRPEWAR